jgi:hypothetical protein
LSFLIFLRESTWGYPIISAIHVLGIAWFGGTVLIARFDEDLRGLRRIGLGVLLASGALLFALHPLQYSNSTSFRLKIALLLLLIRTRVGSPFSIALWIAIIFASRGIAFF